MTPLFRQILKKPPTKRQVDPAMPRFRRGASPLGQIVGLIGLVAALVFLLSLALAMLAHRYDVSRHTGLLMIFGILGMWRWGWAGLHVIRAIIYRYGVYPILRMRAARAVRMQGSVPEVYALATTYKENVWITDTVFGNLFQELGSLRGLRRAATVIAFGRAEAANDGQLIAHLGQLRQVFADPQSRGLGGDLLELAAVGVARLHVERVGLRGTAGHPEQNAVPLGRGPRGGLGQSRQPSAGRRA